ncbi:cytochrome P450 [Streptomyces sp. PRh5]|uniref:cytochrome P450 n=1 Tax=Streptomyces sp. PRh5 TaxID=1158056 RepID=UPI00044E683F|nr:cytochrome P450 [Streptomyces sp. PRh5]EXU61582.1 cytochrome P450 [Streptomyces sp. PRh5]
MASPVPHTFPFHSGTAGTSPGGCPAALGTRAPLDLLDLFSDGFVRDPYPWLDRLRAEAPVHYDPDTGLWLVSRYDDVRRVLLDPTLFRPDNALRAVTPLPVAALRILAQAGFTHPPALANNGTPSHPGLRRVVTRFFNAERVAAAIPVIQRVAKDLLDAVRSEIDATGRCELFSSFAQVLPCRVLMELLGIRGVTPGTLIRWSDASLELFWGRPTPDRQRELAEFAQKRPWPCE